MRGNYIGKKPVQYDSITSTKPGVWEIYDQGQFVRDSTWASQPWDVANGVYANKQWTVGLTEATTRDLSFKSDGTKFYVAGETTDTVYQYSCATAWDVSTASYDNKSFSVTAQEGTPAGLFFKNDGTKFYIVGGTNDTVYQYSCSTAWDISTGSYDSKSFSVSAQESDSRGLFFKSDGTKFYIVGITNDTVYQYSCSTAWDISTGSYDSKSFSVNTQEPNPNALFFKDDGTKFYIVGLTSDRVYQYSCATAWDVSTASYDSISFSITAQETDPTGLFFKDDGTKFYVVGTTNNRVFEYSLSTAWDVSTANGAGGSFSVAAQENLPQDVQFKDDGTKFYIVGTGNDTVYQYSCSTAWDISTASYDSKSFSVNAQEGNPNALFFKSDGTKFYIVGTGNDTVYQYSCSTAWDISTASYDSKSFSVTGQDGTPHGLFFKNDGTKFYVIGSTNDTVYQYSCATAWDISTASYDSKSFSVTAQETGPTGLFFKSDGTKFYIVGITNRTADQYSCATAWDVSTASYDSKSFSVTAQDGTPNGLFFKPDGTRLYTVGSGNDTVNQYALPLAWDVLNAGYLAKNMRINLQEPVPHGLFFKPDGLKFYIQGDTNDRVYQYTCSIPWDITSAIFNHEANYGSFPFAGQDGNAKGISFKSDGTKLYLLGDANNSIYQYSCNTAWDISTASYDSKSFSVTGQDGTPQGLFFKDDGTKFYIVGNTNDTVYQYSCSTAWDISTGSYDSILFSVNAQDGTPFGLFFKDDGTKFYIVGSTNDRVYQYSCSTAWDISTASYDNKSLSVATQDGTPTEVSIGYYGTILYMIGDGNNAVFQYYLT